MTYIVYSHGACVAPWTINNFSLTSLTFPRAQRQVIAKQVHIRAYRTEHALPLTSWAAGVPYYIMSLYPLFGFMWDDSHSCIREPRKQIHRCKARNFWGTINYTFVGFQFSRHLLPPSPHCNKLCHVWHPSALQPRQRYGLLPPPQTRSGTTIDVHRDTNFWIGADTQDCCLLTLASQNMECACHNRQCTSLIGFQSPLLQNLYPA